MRKRKWQTVLYLFLIFVLSGFYIHMHQLYFSPEDVFYACERGLHSGPSEKIVLQHELEDGGLMLVGRQDDGLFVVPVEKTHFFLWRMKGGRVDGFIKCDKPLNGYLTYDGHYLGLSLDEKITEMSFILGNHPDLSWREYVCPVADELVFIEAEQIWGDAEQNTDDYIVYTEGRNVSGEVIYQDGETALAESLRKGNIRPSDPVVQKQYITVSNVE
jgi:hypothetical protein